MIEVRCCDCWLWFTEHLLSCFFTLAMQRSVESNTYVEDLNIQVNSSSLGEISFFYEIICMKQQAYQKHRIYVLALLQGTGWISLIHIMLKQQVHHPVAVGVVPTAVNMTVASLLDHLFLVQVHRILDPVVVLDKQRIRILELLVAFHLFQPSMLLHHLQQVFSGRKLLARYPVILCLGWRTHFCSDSNLDSQPWNPVTDRAIGYLFEFHSLFAF